MRILLVEDDPVLADIVQRSLRTHGHRVDAAADMDTARLWWRTQPFDAVLLDLNLPASAHPRSGLGNGLDLLREARARGDRTPVIVLTARDRTEQRIAGLDAGADDYLVKPFAFRELLARLRALLRRAADAPKVTLLQVADLTLDTRTQRVQRAGRTIELTAKEFAVLEALMRDPGRVLSRTVIADHVWSYDAFNQSNVIDVYIRNLRRKIDDGSTVKLIETVRGVGYRVVAVSNVASR